MKEVLSLEDLAALQRAVFDIYVDPSLVSYAVDVATATREPAAHGLPELAQYISYGASPRGPISLVQGARALGVDPRAGVRPSSTICKRSHATRCVTAWCSSYQALAEEVTPDSILDQVLAAVPTPQIDLARASAA